MTKMGAMLVRRDLMYHLYMGVCSWVDAVWHCDLQEGEQGRQVRD